MPRWQPITLFILASAAALLRSGSTPPAEFLPQSPALAATAQAETVSAPPASADGNWVVEKITAASGEVGPSSLAILPNGKLLLAWQETRGDDPAETRLRLMARQKNGRWGEAQDLATRPQVAAQRFAYLSRLGQPLIYGEGHWLHLWFIGYGVDDLRQAVLHHRYSSDGGANWSGIETLAIAPAFNPGGLRLQPPIPLGNDELALPLSENHGQTRSWLRLAATGKALDKLRLAAGEILLPGGPLTVNAPTGTEFILPLSRSHLLAAVHPEGERKQLQLQQSTDGGARWSVLRTLEQGDDGAAEFTHPFLLRAANGRIHLSYTWRRQGLRLVSFDAPPLPPAGAQKP